MEASNLDLDHLGFVPVDELVRPSEYLSRRLCAFDKTNGLVVTYMWYISDCKLKTLEDVP